MIRGNTDDSWGTAVVYDGEYNNVNNKLGVIKNDIFTANAFTGMLMRNLRRYDLSYADAQTAIDAMMNGTFPSDGPGSCWSGCHYPG